jgi:hypothetical protein
MGQLLGPEWELFKWFVSRVFFWAKRWLPWSGQVSRLFPILLPLPLGSSLLYALHPHLHCQSCEEYSRVRRHETGSRE